MEFHLYHTYYMYKSKLQGKNPVPRCYFCCACPHLVGRETHLKLCLHTEGGVQRDHGHWPSPISNPEICQVPLMVSCPGSCLSCCCWYPSSGFMYANSDKSSLYPKDYPAPRMSSFFIRFRRNCWKFLPTIHRWKTALCIYECRTFEKNLTNKESTSQNNRKEYCT